MPRSSGYCQALASPVLCRGQRGLLCQRGPGLDIREAEFIEADLRGMPGHLVRRDPATQSLVTREKALQSAWRTLDFSKTYWPDAIELFLEGGLSSVVLVAPKRVSSFRKLLDGLEKLRDAGVAEPA